jgi:hypothetical protein
MFCWLCCHLGIILANYQLDAHFFSICLFQFSTCFEQPRAHHQENQLYQYNIWYVSLCVGDRLVCRSFPTCILDGHPHRVTHNGCTDTIDSPNNVHKVCSKHVENWSKHIEKELYVKLVIYMNFTVCVNFYSDYYLTANRNKITYFVVWLECLCLKFHHNRMTSYTVYKKCNL